MDNQVRRIAFNYPNGVYLIEYDTRIPTATTSQTLRLLIGQSKQGVVNKVTYHDTYSSVEEIYGKLDRSQERKGNFFHRAASIMLQTAPILMLNVRSFDDTLDKTGMIEFATQFAKENADIKIVPYTSAFDTNRFWYIDPEEIADLSNNDQLLSVMNVGDTKKTVYIKKSTDSGYSLTVEKYYDTLGKPIPAYLNPDDSMNDMFVQVYLFDKDLSDNTLNMRNAAYGHLFDENGLKARVTDAYGNEVSGLDQLALITESGYRNTFEGSIIPDLTEADGATPACVEYAINSTVDTYGLIARVNYNTLEIGADWEGVFDEETDEPDYTNNGQKKSLPIDLVGHGLADTIADGSIDTTAYDARPVNVLSYSFTTAVEDYDLLSQSESDLAEEITLYTLKNGAFEVKNTIDEGTGEITNAEIADRSTFIYWGDMNIVVGAKFIGRTSNLVSLTELNYLGKSKILLGLHTSKLPLQGTGEVFPQDANGVFIYPVGHVNAGEAVEYDVITDAPLVQVGGSVIPFPTLTEEQLDAIRESHGTERYVYKMQFDGELSISGTTEITVSDPVAYDDARLYIKFTDGDSMEYFNNTNDVYFQKAVEDSIDNYVGFVLKGYKARKEQFADGTASRLNEVLNTLTNELRSPLIDKNNISFDYIVDSFKTFIEPNAKNQIALIAGERKLCTYLMSAPSIKDMKKSVDPYFRSTIGGKFKLPFIKTGGNTSLPYTKTLSLSQSYQNFVGCYSPSIVVRDAGLELLIPPSFAVSNSFIIKTDTGDPHDAVAGKNRGTIIMSGMEGIEYDFDDEDRLALERVGINPIVLRNGSYRIYDDITLQVSPKTALSYLSVREMLNYLAKNILPMLEDYQFDRNNVTIRNQIKQYADSICQGLQDSGGIVSYENIINLKNNDTEIIENAMGLLDTVIVPTYPMRKIIYRITVTQSGANISVL